MPPMIGPADMNSRGPYLPASEPNTGESAMLRIDTGSRASPARVAGILGNLLQEHHDEEAAHRQGAVDRDRGDVAHPEVAHSEQAERHHRLLRRVLAPEERGERQDTDRQGQVDCRAAHP